MYLNFLDIVPIQYSKPKIQEYKMANISMLGIGSRGATSELIQHLKEVENLRLKPLQIKTEKIKSKISAWGKVHYLLQNILQKLDIDSQSFSSFKPNENECFVATGGNSENSYQVEVIQLAKKHVLSLSLQKASNIILGNSENVRYLNITQGDKKNNTVKTTRIKLNKNDTTLDKIAKAINKFALNVNAEVNITNFKENCLVIKSNIFGSNGKLAINVEGDSQLDDLLHFPKNDKNAVQTKKSKIQENQKAQGSIVKIDGIKYYRENNTIKDIIKNVSLNLIKTSKNNSKIFNEGEKLQFVLDKTLVSKSLKEFVLSFNKFLDQALELKKFIPENNENSYLKNKSKSQLDSCSLFGDSVLTHLIDRLKKCTLINYCDYKKTKISSLTDLGINIEKKTGKLIFDQDKLNKHIHMDWIKVKEFLIGKKDQIGFIKQMSQVIQEHINNDKKSDGASIIQYEIKDLEMQNQMIHKNILHTQQMIQNKMNLYQVQFQKLDVFLTKTESISKQISMILSSNKN
ncbi:MAG: flagellar filament capping protein FliD [Wigglesworthia glossinidia]|nr:flagellar filament capping protein FliD [Wigglesworthia glossinidia]